MATDKGRFKLAMMTTMYNALLCCCCLYDNHLSIKLMKAVLACLCLSTKNTTKKYQFGLPNSTLLVVAVVADIGKIRILVDKGKIRLRANIQHHMKSYFSLSLFFCAANLRGIILRRLPGRITVASK